MNLSVIYEMLNYLMKKEKVTAQEIAQEFEINQRSVYRYVNFLTLQNIPINCLIGRNGGISIDKKYKLESAILLKEELDLLKNLLTNSNDPLSKGLLSKLNLF